MGFFRQEYWSGFPFPPPTDLPHLGIEPTSLALQTDSLPFEPFGTLDWSEVSSPQASQGAQSVAKRRRLTSLPRPEGPKAPWGPRMPDSSLSWKADSVSDPRPSGLNPSSAPQPRDSGKSVKLNISSQFPGHDLRLHNMCIASLSTSTNCEVHALFFPIYRKGN